MDARKVSPYTDFFYARPSFLEGIGRLVDFFGSLQEYNVSSSPGAADARAIRADWMAVGNDMRVVLRESGYRRKERAEKDSINPE